MPDHFVSFFEDVFYKPSIWNSIAYMKGVSL